MVKDYIGSVVDACGEIFHGAFAKLIDPEDNVVYISDPIYVVLKDIDAEWMEQVWKWAEKERSMSKTKNQDGKSKPKLLFDECCRNKTQLFLMPETEMTGSEPSRRTLPITESLASAQYRRSLK